MRDLLPPDEAEARLEKRFAEFNVWRNIVHEPVEMTPLGLVDSESLAPRDLAVCDLVYADRTGEIYQGVYNADHRWYNQGRAGGPLTLSLSWSFQEPP